MWLFKHIFVIVAALVCHGDDGKRGRNNLKFTSRSWLLMQGFVNVEFAKILAALLAERREEKNFPVTRD